MQEQPRPQRRQPPGDRVPDTVSPAHPGDQGGPPEQGERIPPQLVRDRFVPWVQGHARQPRPPPARRHPFSLRAVYSGTVKAAVMPPSRGIAAAVMNPASSLARNAIVRRLPPAIRIGPSASGPAASRARRGSVRTQLAAAVSRSDRSRPRSPESRCGPGEPRDRAKAARPLPWPRNRPSEPWPRRGRPETKRVDHRPSGGGVLQPKECRVCSTERCWSDSRRTHGPGLEVMSSDRVILAILKAHVVVDDVDPSAAVVDSAAHSLDLRLVAQVRTHGQLADVWLLRSTPTTTAPSSSKRRATAAPIALAAPLTMQTLSSNRVTLLHIRTSLATSAAHEPAHPPQ